MVVKKCIIFSAQLRLVSLSIDFEKVKFNRIFCEQAKRFVRHPKANFIPVRNIHIHLFKWCKYRNNVFCTWSGLFVFLFVSQFHQLDFSSKNNSTAIASGMLTTVSAAAAAIMAINFIVRIHSIVRYTLNGTSSAHIYIFCSILLYSFAYRQQFRFSAHNMGMFVRVWIV